MMIFHVINFVSLGFSNDFVFYRQMAEFQSFIHSKHFVDFMNQVFSFEEAILELRGKSHVLIHKLR